MQIGKLTYKHKRIRVFNQQIHASLNVQCYQSQTEATQRPQTLSIVFLSAQKVTGHCCFLCNASRHAMPADYTRTTYKHNFRTNNRLRNGVTGSQRWETGVRKQRALAMRKNSVPHPAL